MYLYMALLKVLKKTTILLHGGRMNQKPHVIHWLILMSESASISKGMEHVGMEGALFITVPILVNFLHVMCV